LLDGGNKSTTPTATPVVEPPVTSVTALANAANAALATMPQNEAEATQFLSTLFGGQVGMDISDVAQSVDQGGMAFKQVIARVSQGQWNTPKNSCPEDKYEVMPAGNRPFLGVLLGYRVGATGWAGEATTGTGKPPVYRFVVPHPKFDSRGSELVAKTLGVGKKINFTKRVNRTKFDVAGRLSPEVHILVWTPQTEFVTLVSTSFNSCQKTIEALKGVIERSGCPYRFNIKNEVITNNNAKEGDANKSWDNYYIEAQAAIDDKGAAMMQQFKEFANKNALTLVGEVMNFLRGDDYNGLKGDALNNKLAEYDSL
jgi:hypothetical protein